MDILIDRYGLFSCIIENVGSTRAKTLDISGSPASILSFITLNSKFPVKEYMKLSTDEFIRHNYFTETRKYPLNLE